MRYKYIILSLLLSNYCFGQVSTVLDSLDNPIAFTFVNENIYLALHGSPQEGKIVSFNISDPLNTYQIHFDSLTYPRAIIEKDSVLYIGLRDGIVAYDLKNTYQFFDTLFQEQFLFPRSFAFDGNDLIFAQEKALSKIDLSIQNADKEILFFFEENPLSLAKSNNSIYIAEGKSIHQYDLNSNMISEIISDLEFNTYSILIVNNHLYLDQGNFGAKEIVVYDLNNLNNGPQSFCSDLGSAISLNEYQGQIYFASQKPVFNGMPEGKIQIIEKGLVSTNDLIVGSMKVYPNPTNNIINIESPNTYNYKLYDVNGKRMINDFYTNQLELGGLPDGIYILQYNSLNGIKLGSIRIIKRE